MLGLLLGHVPWWVWVILGVPVALAALRFLGPRGSLAVLAGTAGVALYSWARRSGYREAEARQERREVRAVRGRQQVQKSASAASEEDLKRRLERWSRPQQ